MHWVTTLSDQITRLDDWQARLTAYLARVSRAEFKYGEHDCAIFCAGAVKAMTGRDFARGYRGYRTRNAGIKKLASAGYEDHVDFVSKHFEEVPPAFAKVGDIAIFEGAAMGIFQGRGVFVLTEGRMFLASRMDCEKAFRV